MKEGEMAPDFSLQDQDGKVHKLSEYRGKRVVLYFYPKDDTPGCTKEACAFRDDIGTFLKKGAVVLGVSKDSAASHQKFRAKYSLPFALLSDSDAAVQKLYGVWQPKKFLGREFLGTVRSTFLIDAKGRIAKAWSPVTVDGHSAEILAAL